MSGHLVLDASLEERLGPLHRCRQLSPTTLLNQVRRVEPIGHVRYPEVEVEPERRLQLVTAQGRLGPSLVGIEGEDDPLSEPSEQVEMTFA
jgi:hypothetical protein